VWRDDLHLDADHVAQLGLFDLRALRAILAARQHIAPPHAHAAVERFDLLDRQKRAQVRGVVQPAVASAAPEQEGPTLLDLLEG